MSPTTAKTVGILNIVVWLFIFADYKDTDGGNLKALGLIFLIAIPLALLNLVSAGSGLLHFLFKGRDFKFAPSFLALGAQIVFAVGLMWTAHLDQQAKTAPAQAQTVPKKIK